MNLHDPDQQLLFPVLYLTSDFDHDHDHDQSIVLLHPGHSFL